MRQYQLQPAGDASALTLATAETPEPAPGEALVRVRATSLNYRDLLILKGKAEPGRIPLSDGAGEVVALGEGVTNIAIGDRVAANFFTGWISGRFSMSYHDTALGGAINGMLTEFISLPAAALVKIPDSLTFEQASALPCAGVTAWNALFTRGNLQLSDTVLVQGTGGVSIFGLQFAVAAGARVIVTSSSDAKRERAQAMGAWQTINYKTTPDWEKEAYRLTEKRGVDHIIEVGGPDTYERSLKALAAGGHMAQVGVLSGFDFRPNVWPVTGKNATISGVYVGSAEHFRTMNTFIEQHAILPVVDRVFPFEEAPAAYDYLESGGHFGKVVIAV